MSSRKKQIGYLIVGDSFVTFNSSNIIFPGGTERYIFLLAKYVQKFGLETTVIYPQFKGGRKSNGMIFNFRYKSFYSPKYMYNWFIDLFSFINTYKTIKKIKPDIVHIISVKYRFSLGAIIAAKMCQKKIVYTRTTPPNMNTKSKLAVLLDDFVVVPLIRKKIDVTIALTSEMKLILESLEFNNVHYIPNFIELPKFVKSFSPQKNHRLLYVGRVEENKGIMILLQAIAKLISQKINVCLFLIGPCKTPEYFENIITEYNLNKHVFLMGTLPYNNLLEYYQKCDCFVFPSLLEGGHAMAILEAMSYGLPIIASDIKPNQELLENGKCGLLYSCQKPIELCNNIIHLLEDEKLIHYYSNLSYERSKSYSATTIVSNLLEILDA
ncbi:glycosyltransferase family 4 protein [uncultured Methanolobus sp.]|uniref:glycosyltransferase family 4 protein n=1 Tax=uncultured Methanolobus sp. TaxID=218300 RepID=UPI002AAAEF2F|nr:glycosyltransferase family 4 protein [uncultured Methanolobus sp.]